MPRLRALQNFWERRMRIPVKGKARVLDVGSGDKPHWRADVLLDWKPTKADGAQRSGFAEARVTRPLFYGDAADMPFADRSFDYVVCSHVLEHVHDPAAVLREMMRVPQPSTTRTCSEPQPHRVHTVLPEAVPCRDTTRNGSAPSGQPQCGQRAPVELIMATPRTC